jgi:hypothetical protein
MITSPTVFALLPSALTPTKRTQRDTILGALATRLQGKHTVQVAAPVDEFTASTTEFLNVIVALAAHESG